MANFRVTNWHWLCRNGFALVLAIVAGSGGRVHGAEETTAKPGLAWIEFFSSNFTRPAMTGVDRQLNHDNGTLHSDYSRMWIGWVEFPVTGEVTLVAEADDGVRLHVGDRLVIDGWKARGTHDGKFNATAGQSLPITVEFFQNGGTAHVRLFWNARDLKRVLIPENAFRHTSADLQRVAELRAGKQSVATALEQVRKQTASQKSAPQPLPSLTKVAVDFARDIQPLLAKRCQRCHGTEKHEGGLRLDLRRTALQGGDSGDTIVPGSSAKSRLIARVSEKGNDDRMPPDGDPLTEPQIQLLRAWIDQGAAWPDALAGKDTAAEHWSFQPIKRPAVPNLKSQISNLKFQNSNRKPQGSNPKSEISNLKFEIHNPIDAFILARLEKEGITPTPEADRFTLLRRLSLDLTGLPPTPEEVQQFVDDIRPEAYAEVVDRLLASEHFGERWGRHWLDLARYADSDGYENDNARPNAWRFRDWVVQSINRDQPFDQFTIEQLAGDLLPDAQIEQLVATGFHRNTLHNSAGGADKEEFRSKAVKDRADTTGGVWLGLTLNCCQCHSHKYDPIAHREYYSFYAFFNNADDASVKVSGGEASILRPARRITQVHLRGNFLSPGVEVQPQTPAFLPALRSRGELPDRLDLARWIVDPQHPLTARVQVNHFWQHLFGTGLVATPENFGRNGQRPTHPELLDWLAAEFIDMKWSRKALIRTIVMSATDRQASTYRPELAERDPANTLWARQNRQPLEAEIVRDSALAVSGLLRPELGGPSIQPVLPKGLAVLGELKNERFQEQRGDRHRRGLYIHMQRTFQYPMLAAFDAPDGNQPCPRRDRSNTPIQALTLLNDPAFVECSQALGQRLMKVSGDREHRLRQAFSLCLGRAASDAELTVLRELLTELERQKQKEEAVWAGVARAVMNLDEFVTRE